MYKDVVWLSLTDAPARGYWDQAMLEDVLVNKRHHTEIGDLKEAIVIIPTPDQNPADINKELAKLSECIVICTSDEWHRFDLAKLKHPDMILYGMYAYDTKAEVVWLPIGYTPHGRIPEHYEERPNDIYFSGQVNHKSREEMVKHLKVLPNFVLQESAGFAQGIDPVAYINNIKESKVVPAPSGNISPDSFRLYEALENGAVPVAEDPSYFTKLFQAYPFPAVSKPEQWKGYCEDAVKLFPSLNNRCSSWWQSWKCNLYNAFNTEDEITVVVPVSPIASHPSTAILDETIASIRAHTDAEIIVTFDGVRKEQEDKRADYELFINRFLTSCPQRVRPIIFDAHMHQSGMMRAVANLIMTPMMLYVEQDTPLITDLPIDWDLCKAKIMSGESDLVRFHYDASIHKEHKHMMLDKKAVGGFMRTSQWSQRPHLASTAFYRRIMRTCFTDESNCFIEDHMHGVCHNTYIESGEQGWQQYKLHIYHPSGDIKRSYHTDGRAGEKKFDDKQIF